MTEGKPFCLTGQGCLVTGAGSGIGEAIACLMASQGTFVAVNDIWKESAEQTCTKITEAGGRAVCVPGDVSQLAGAERVVQTALTKLGRLDILVNNAAAPVALKKFWEMSPEDWEASLSSFYATLCCLHAAIKPMMEQKYGRVINVGSLSGAVGGVDMTVYAAAKGGIHAFTTSLAKEVAPYGITVNCVAPGAVETPRMRGRPADVRAKRLANIPIGRFAQSAEIAWAVVFLASQEASYITGEVLFVDGGRP